MSCLVASEMSANLATQVEFAEDFSVTYRGTYKVWGCNALSKEPFIIPYTASHVAEAHVALCAMKAMLLPTTALQVVVNKRANETYVLYQCGTPNPVTLAGTETGVPSGTKVFEVPLTSVAVTDSNAAAFLVALGLVDRVARASEYSVDPCLQAVHRA